MTFVLILIAMMVAVLVFMNIWTRRLTRQGRKAVPQPGQIAPVRGGTIHYVEKGDPAAQTIVMIHGLAGQLQHFTYALVDKLAEDFHVIAIDRPGCGYSTRYSAKSGELPVQARMIDEFLQSKGVTQTVLVGHSLGGAVSLAMALHQPDRVAALALLAPLTHTLPETPAVFKPLEIRTGWLRNLIGHTLAVPIAAKTAPYTLTAVFEPEPAPDDFLDRAGGALGLRPSAFITASQDVAGVEASIQAQCARYSDLRTPGGILFGAEDAILSPALHGSPMAEFGLNTEMLERVGHMLPITQPETCANFIRRIARAARMPNVAADEAAASQDQT